MDPNAIIGTILTTAALSAPNTGGAVAPNGANVHTGSTYQSVHIRNTIQGDNAGGTSVTTVDTNDNGVVNHRTQTEHIPAGAAQQITVSNLDNAARINSEIYERVDRQIRKAKASAPAPAADKPTAAAPALDREIVSPPALDVPETGRADVAPLPGLPAAPAALPEPGFAMRIQEAFKAFFDRIRQIFGW